MDKIISNTNHLKTWPILAIFITADENNLVIINATIIWKLLPGNKVQESEVIFKIRRVSTDADEVIFSAKESNNGHYVKRKTILSHVDSSFRPNQENTYVLAMDTWSEEFIPKILDCQFSSRTLKKDIPPLPSSSHTF